MENLTLADITRFLLIALMITFIGAPILVIAVRWWSSILQLASYGLV